MDRPSYGFGPCKIPRITIAEICELYDLTAEDFEKIIYLEGLMYPFIFQHFKSLTNGDK